MYIDRIVGRLVETRWVSPMSDENMQHFLSRTAVIFKAAQGPLVVFADVTQALVLPQERINELIALMKSDNEKIERNGMLLGQSATFALQVERVIRQAGNPKRRTFREFAPLRQWLAPVLTPDELVRIDDFRKESNELLRSAPIGTR